MSDSESSGDLEVELSDPSSDEELRSCYSEESDDSEAEGEIEVTEAKVENGAEVLQVQDDAEEDDVLPLTAEQQVHRREANIRALVQDSLEIHRKPMLPKLLSVQDAAAVILRKPFKSPHPNAPARTNTLKRALIARKQFVPWGSGKPFQSVIKISAPQFGEEDLCAAPPPAVELPPGIDPLILWEPSPGEDGPCVRVDDALTRFLRPHQREGVQFMFECVTGLRSFDGQGCILADDMGLGKTLQGIALLWTLLNCGHEELGGMPLARRVIICCPTSLVSNWDSECTKWLNGRIRTLPLCESSREDVIATINQFLSPRCPAQLLIVSYETFRLHAERFQVPGSCDLLICDEAHRLKNDQTLTNRALASLECRRRVLLSGTPMQNQLQEFFSMVNFCNPGVLGTPSEFRRRFEAPILAGREPDATDNEKEKGTERSSELSSIVNDFILRRTNALLSAHLPPKVVEVVCCRMTPLQYELYCHFVSSRSVQSLFSAQKSARVLSAITSVRKLLNHPKLIYDATHSTVSGSSRGGEKVANGFEGCAELFPPGLFDSGGRGARSGTLPSGWENLSGKFAVVSRMLALLREQTRDRVVIVSNFTQTLDLFTALCREMGYPCLRLDGSTSIAKRQKLVKKFNDHHDNQYVFLLSSKAGGCGLNLVGGNRLILFDMSWNPADDKQAAARVWRDGQQRRVYVYKFMTTGTIEEKVYQRQLSKEGLQAVVDSKQGGGTAESNLMSVDELRDLFSYDPDTLSTTYDHMVANKGMRRKKKKEKTRGGKKGKSGSKKRMGEDVEEDDDGDTDEASDAEEESEEDGTEESGVKRLKSGSLAAAGIPIYKEQVGDPKEDDLATWAHHSDPTTVPDQAMQLTGGEDVSFVFSCQVDGREVPPDPPLAPMGQGQKRVGGDDAGLGARGPRRAMMPIRAGPLTAPGLGHRLPHPHALPKGDHPEVPARHQGPISAPLIRVRKALHEIPSAGANVNDDEMVTSSVGRINGVAQKSEASRRRSGQHKKRKSPLSEQGTACAAAAPPLLSSKGATPGTAMAPNKRTAVLYDSDDDDFV